MLAAAIIAALLAKTAVADPARQTVVWNAALDLRELPPKSRPSQLRAAVDARQAVAAGVQPIFAVAVNGIVIARVNADARAPTRIVARLDDRLLAVRNRVEISLHATCNDRRCERALSAVPPIRQVGISLDAPAAGVTDFSQIVTRLRPGIAFRSDGSVAAPALARGVQAALAPLAPADPRGPATILISREAPKGVRPPLRFDLGPVRIDRSDGAPVVSEAKMGSITAVQLIRGGGRPLIWVRPADDGTLPPSFEIDRGNVALFDRNGRVISFSTSRDRAVKIAYPPGSDAYGTDRTMLIWRLSLLGIWLIASITLFLFWRRLRRTAAARAAA